MKRKNKLLMNSSVACVLAIFAMLAFETTTRGKLATNRLGVNRLGPFSAAASSAAASKLAARRNTNLPVYSGAKVFGRAKAVLPKTSNRRRTWE